MKLGVQKRLLPRLYVGLILAALLAPPAVFANEPSPDPEPGSEAPAEASPYDLPAAPSQVPVRIGVGRSQRAPVVTAAHGMFVIAEGAIHWNTPPGTRLTFSVVEGKIQVDGLRDHFESPIRLVPLETGQPNFVSFKNRTYRGEIEVMINPNDPTTLTVVNVVNLEDYLRGVVPWEMSPSWPEEALKAQAVAARTYALQYLASRFVSEGFQLTDTTESQVYGGVGAEHPRTDAAIAATAGKVLTLGGNMVTAYYHATSGGHTENNNVIWGNGTGSPLPYLVGVPDFDQVPLNQRFAWDLTMTVAEMSEALTATGYGVGTVRSVTPSTTMGVSGRPTHWTITGTAGTQTLRAEQVRFALGLFSSPRRILLSSGEVAPSTKTYTAGASISVVGVNEQVSTRKVSGSSVLTALGLTRPAPSVITAMGAETPSHNGVRVEGGGWGHGVGMSQWGAYGMAQQGMSYVQILTHFYQGTKVENH